MTEIFISYCRRNKGFTEQFIQGLAEQNYPADKIWIDWNNIPPSSKWEDEIRKGIEACNAVVFILSPDWILSNECRKELEIAIEYNKRLFPIIHQNIDPQSSPAALASLNWIFFREADDFKGAMQKLMAAINTDLDWVKQHTVLLKRANEWNSKKQDGSYLLRGSELQGAELWLSKSSDNKQPHPTPLQSEYIFASRQDASRRQRNTLIGVSAALVVSILLAIAAIVGGVEAVRKSQQALASQLAAQSITLVDTQPDLSLLL
ncbi:MAG TPA: toll/interleukin-1 receptor domain-containing protein, partial [Anaerolineales bacterium]|nr:toll/interleukin-1 receptor domain-containing protein [Anaerolineales bacterium]